MQSLASTRALENVLPLAMACRVGHETAGPNLAFDSMGPSCVISQPGKFIARLDRGEGLAVGQNCDQGRRSLSDGKASRPIGRTADRSFTVEPRDERFA